MALTAPILYDTSAFDATQAHTFYFWSIGIDVVTANTLIIKNADNLTTVYSQEQTTYSWEHTVPANTLSNGVRYQAIIKTKGLVGGYSKESKPIQFYCYTMPTFSFTNISQGSVITDSMYQFTARYNQAQSEYLDAYKFNLYDSTNNLISTSGNKYAASTTLPTDVSYTFNGLANNTSYKIECVGSTIHGTIVSTPLVTFSVAYETPSGFTELELTNNCSGGYIKVKSTVVAIEGNSYPSPPTYIDNSAVDLRQYGSYVEFDSGYQIDNNFTARFWCKQLTAGANVITFSNIDGSIIEIYYEEDSTNAWCELYAKSSPITWSYCIKSATIAKPSSSHNVFIWIRRINEYYDIRIQDLGA